MHKREKHVRFEIKQNFRMFTRTLKAPETRDDITDDAIYTYSTASTAYDPSMQIPHTATQCLN